MAISQITSNSIAAGAVSASDLADASITPAKLSTGAPYWDSSGNVGIGTTSPDYKLDVDTSVNSNFVARVINNAGSTSSDHALLVETSTASAARIISARNAGTERFYVAGNGDVGVINNFFMNSGYGSAAIAYGCRAWVCFNGSGTLAIKASGNVTSVTDNGTGDYTVNFTNAMPDANYAIATCGVIPDDAGGAPAFFLKGPTGWGSNPTLKTTTQARMLNRREANLDMADCSVSIFR